LRVIFRPAFSFAPPKAVSKLPQNKRLDPGKASFLNNYTVMHARSEFDDWEQPDKKRLMLRLWLDVDRKARPLVRQIHIYENVGGRSDIDRQPGRLPAVANAARQMARCGEELPRDAASCYADQHTGLPGAVIRARDAGAPSQRR
jgi:hypothetical protein